jgi:hypothetical protein
LKAKKLVPYQYKEYGWMAVQGLYSEGVRIARRCELKPPTKDDMAEYNDQYDSLLHYSMRVIRSTPKKEPVDLFAGSPFITPTKQKTQSPKPKKSYEKEQMLSPLLPPSAEKQSY